MKRNILAVAAIGAAVAMAGRRSLGTLGKAGQTLIADNKAAGQPAPAWRCGHTSTPPA